VSPQIAEFLFQKGMDYYEQAQYDKALVEFKKALLANPESSEVRHYISILQDVKEAPPSSRPSQDVDKRVVKEREQAGATSREGTASKEPMARRRVDSKYLSRLMQEVESSVIAERKVFAPPISQGASTSLSESRLQNVVPAFIPEPAQDITLEFLTLDKTVSVHELKLSVDDCVLFQGENVQRMLATHPALVRLEKVGDDDVRLKAQEIGTTYLNIWDKNGRKDFRIIIDPRRFKLSAGAAGSGAGGRFVPGSRPFQVTASIDGSSFMTGRRLENQKRVSHTTSYGSSVSGDTPFGFFDSAVQGQRTQQGSLYVPNLRMSLTDAHYKGLKDIDIHGFDFTPSFDAFGFPTPDLRGVLVEAPVAGDRFQYMTFWGSLPKGNFTVLDSASGLSKRKRAYLEGLGLNARLTKDLNLKTYYAHSYGPELTQPVVTNDAMGAEFSYGHLGWHLRSGMTSDMQHKSYEAQSQWSGTKWNVGLSMTDMNKNMASPLGGEPSSGSIGGTLNVNYRFWPDLMFVNSISGIRDRVFGNPDRPTRPNYTSTSRVIWTVDPQTEVEAGYDMDDRIGSNTPSVTETKEIVYRKKVFLVRRLSTYVNFQNRKSKNYTSPAQDYNNNRILAGLSFRVISDVYAYYRREFNLLRNRYSGDTASPYAQEMGLNQYRQLFGSPFYLSSRLFYRDEQNTESTLSYLSGEDRLEAEEELTYKPDPNMETYLRVRLTNVWAEREGVAKHVDVDVAWGMRLVWEPGITWRPSGGFNGYVYYDVNGNGKKDSTEKGVGGVRIRVEDGQSVMTTATGYYFIRKVVGKATTLSLDAKTVPAGFSSTTDFQRSVEIVHAATQRVDFGITTRTELQGLVYHDKNGNGVYDAGDEPQKGVVILLDGKKKGVSSVLGEYMFRNIGAGDHTISIDLKTVPLKFIPKVPVRRTVRIFEGVTFSDTIPLESQSK
jgi:hypothetical protein